MKSDFVQYLSALIVLVVAGALEEFLPKILGVGFPVLLACVQFFACRRPAVVAFACALAAGGVEDSLSSLPPMTSVGFFAAVMALVRWTRLPVAATAVSYPAYQVWLWVWAGESGGEVWLRLLTAVPVGVLTATAVLPVLSLLERKAALDEA